MRPLLEKIRGETVLQTLRNLVFKTRVEIVAGVFAAGTLAGVLSYRDNKKKEAHLPVAFSEIEDIIARAERDGRAVSPLTMEYAVTNDIAMKLFEANNDALAKDAGHAAFARELERHMDKSQATHATIDAYAQMMPQITQKALLALEKPIGAARYVSPLSAAFEAAWDDSHHDHYRTEFYPVTVCSGSGKSRSCRTETRSRQVYDHTTHTYTYHPEDAARAQALLAAMLRTYPDMILADRLDTATAVNADNQNAILKSMSGLFDDGSPSSHELLRVANTWAHGANFTKYFPEVVKAHKNLAGLQWEWNAAMGTASSQRYDTRSRLDAGPAEFQLAAQGIAQGAALEKNTNDITAGILFADKNVPLLNSKIKQYIDAVLHGGEGDPDALRKEIMKLGPAIYQENFKEGFDVYPFKWSTVLLLTLVGAALGAGLGAGADHGLNSLAARRARRRPDGGYNRNEKSGHRR